MKTNKSKKWLKIKINPSRKIKKVGEKMVQICRVIRSARRLQLPSFQEYTFLYKKLVYEKLELRRAKFKKLKNWIMGNLRNFHMYAEKRKGKYYT